MSDVFLALVLLAIATESMAIPRQLTQFQHRIVCPGGDCQYPPGTAPFIVSLQTTSGFRYCTGSIVNENWIITAAHCTTGDTPSDIRIHAGGENTEFEQVLTVKTILIHDKYGSFGYGYDVSLLELVTPVQLGDDIFVDKIRLAAKGFIPTGSATIYGWGKAGIEVQLIDDAICNQQYPGQIDESMICAIGEEAITCQRDSGGALVYREPDGDLTLIGIVSWGRGCSLDGYAGVFSEVQAMRDWIDANLS